MKLVEANDVSKTYAGKTGKALDRISLSIGMGEIVAVIGHNGAGKSTLFDILGGLMQPDEGTVSMSVDGSKVGWCPQREIVDWSLTVRQNIALGLELRARTARPQRKQIIDDICAAMGLEAFANRTAETLSGGELRRTQIARAMAGDPQLMILDEPTTGLDPSGIQVVFDYLDQRKSAGASALISTHETSRFSTHCTRVIALKDGRLIADLPTHEFMLLAPGSNDLWAAYLEIDTHAVQ